MIWLAVCLDAWAIVVAFFWLRFWRWVDRPLYVVVNLWCRRRFLFSGVFCDGMPKGSFMHKAEFKFGREDDDPSIDGFVWNWPPPPVVVRRTTLFTGDTLQFTFNVEMI